MYANVRCGTHQGYDKHLRNGETACQSCKDAEAARKREQRANKKGSRESIEAALETLYKSLEVVTKAIETAEERNLGQLIKAQRDILNDITKNEQSLELSDSPEQKEESLDPFDKLLRDANRANSTYTPKNSEHM